uniref:Uncharacterized protein n=1 Tax=Anopheles albimanus TaxID=7167 RepID=A0A182FYN7_ANOAL
MFVFLSGSKGIRRGISTKMDKNPTLPKGTLAFPGESMKVSRPTSIKNVSLNIHDIFFCTDM